ncbi:LOW QUALITY PROTEIN: Helitron helicase [Phytophthora megakarya]|uniref:Helitron helicase n=1 Tax=Phytophthora megakarya TaxID=4795 RepID=A0A225UZQ1_9STRA|nr:LOW QUALITY PROTEIN: Helitron helicase [Phytophthora megakarya]
MPEVDRQAIQEQDTAAHQVARDAMTEEEHESHKEAERFRCRSRQYQKGLSYYEDFDPSIIPGGRHYFSGTRTIPRNTSESAHVSTLGSFQMKPTEAAVVMDCVPTARCPPVEQRRLYWNPGFKQLTRAYNNVSVFTSMGSSRFRPLNVDESITRRRSGVYNFRVQGYVCHRMGSLLPPPNRRPMHVQRTHKYTSTIQICKRV